MNARGPAFPTIPPIDPESRQPSPSYPYPQDGIDVRTYLVAHLAKMGRTEDTPIDLWAANVVNHADALINALNNRLGERL